MNNSHTTKVILMTLSLAAISCIPATSNAGLSSWASEVHTFAKGFLRSRKNVGAIFPCSHKVGEELARYFDEHKGKRRILEVGAGTGSVSTVIVEKMHDGDVLDMVELDSGFCDVLNERFADVKNASVNCCSILDWHPKHKYDLVVCTLPFVSFEAPFVEAVLKHIMRLTKRGGHMAHVEFIILPTLNDLALFGEKHKKFTESHAVVNDFLDSFGFDSHVVWRNLPMPIRIYHSKL
jgi:phosphatidylethanolamine/phosphatidyl-N-methylethanolamine N-methyltransferase